MGKDLANSNLEAVEKGLSEMAKMPPAKSFAPPTQRGILELAEELENAIFEAAKVAKVIRDRLSEFDRLQAHFYNGLK